MLGHSSGEMVAQLVGRSPMSMYYNRVMRTLKQWTLQHGD